ncbi:MAG: sigma-54-dependent Fis family transcriptional regulator [Bacteroidales bacterium]|nr:sigma-54-dependent Fis family transcriptional regulator [Bacteroidales bacterium]
MAKKGRILVVDDNAGIRSTLKILLPQYFETVETIPSPSTLVSTLEKLKPHVVLLDMNFNTNINTGNEGLYWIGEIKKIAPKIEVVLFTAYADIQLAVEGMKKGAYDFVVKPWDNDKFLATLAAARDKALENELKPIGKMQKHADADGMFWGNTPQMEVIKKTVEKIAPTDATILITGENGTGKDVLANEIHRLSLRRDKKMIAVDAGALTETLFESELFGHVKGAFTDAHSDHVGKFELANGSTLFLDEIGNIPLHLQAKLLRALQNRVITRVGDTKEIPIDIRLICATNMDLEKLVSDGLFREDLYYRINTMHVVLPSLRERQNDIVPLSEIFIRKFNQRYHRNVLGVSADGAAKLCQQQWSGNIRELGNVIEKAVILADGEYLKAADFQFNKQLRKDAPTVVAEDFETAEKQIIQNAMTKYNGNLSLVAKQLNISRPTLYSKLKKYGI